MESLFLFLKKHENLLRNADLMVAAALMGILMVMIMPLPAVLMDLALTLSITISLMILLVAVYTEKSLEFSVFPSLLLITTLFRLSLNVASTRLILTGGHKGASSAGQVIKAFGDFVIGNNYVIGLIVFIILVVINFVVITKGSGRVAEVAARFTLDALPGKQMSIDADLNAGLITEEDARNRRKEIESEADFYGAMDGASKFVRGDAIAGIVITIVNILGGLLVGVLQKDMTLANAAQNYTMLTVGDGLVSQIPALIISTAAGIVVTRSSSSQNMGTMIAAQLFAKPRALYTVGGIIGLFGLVPGLPKAPFFMVSILLLVTGWAVQRFRADEIEQKERLDEEELRKPQKENIESLLPLDIIELEVGYGLINIVESDESGDLLERIVSIRKQFALELGVIVPSIHIRDNLQLDPGEYRVLIKGNKICGGLLKPEYLMAMDPGNVLQEIEGISTHEPAFGLDALWISPAQKEEAEISGYTVVDLSTVMATHITEVIRTHAHELLGRQEVDTLVENFKKSYPKVIEELIPEKLTLGEVVKVLQSLVKEQVSIRDLLTIFETLADHSANIKDIELLTESVRKSLSRKITNKLLDDEGKMTVINLSAELEEQVSNSLLQTEQGVQLVMDPTMAQRMIEDILSKVQENPEIASQPILLTSPTARRHIFKLVNRFLPQLIVLSHNEITTEAQIQSVATVELAYAG